MNLQQKILYQWHLGMEQGLTLELFRFYRHHKEIFFILLISSTTGLTHVANSPGPLETITTATDFFFIAV